MFARAPQIRIMHKEPPAGTSNSPIFGEIARLSGKYQGTRNIPSYDFIQLGREHRVMIQVDRDGKVYLIPRSMAPFYKRHNFGKKSIGGKERLVPPGAWTDELKRDAIRYCVETIFGRFEDPYSITAVEFREYIPGIFAHFHQNKTKMLEFAGYQLK